MCRAPREWCAMCHDAMKFQLCMVGIWRAATFGSDCMHIITLTVQCSENISRRTRSLDEEERITSRIQQCAFLLRLDRAATRERSSPERGTPPRFVRGETKIKVPGPHAEWQSLNPDVRLGGDCPGGPIIRLVCQATPAKIWATRPEIPRSRDPAPPRKPLSSEHDSPAFRKSAFSPPNPQNLTHRNRETGPPTDRTAAANSLSGNAPYRPGARKPAPA
ncbi:hypothetical protein VTK26DRAFT_8172 [Humicola hyalothermophila]